MLVKALCTIVVCFVAVNAAHPGVYVGPDGNVGASFGGYHASAGLGGLLSGGPKGGLHAQAGTPQGHFASAGLSGSVDSNGATGVKYAGAVKPQYGTAVYQEVQPAQPVYVQQPAQPVYVEQQPQPVYVQQPVQPVYVQKPVHKPSPGFNEIFNIPIATLQAVNQYLNNRPPKVAVVSPAYVLGRSNSESKAEAGAQSQSSSFSGSSASSSASSSAASSSSSSASSSSDKADGGVYVPAEVVPENAVPVNAVPGVLVTKKYRTKYDDIFNIPISVLRSVNGLLNG